MGKNNNANTTHNARTAVKDAHEKCAIEDTLDILNPANDTNFRIIDRPDPPDAIIFDGKNHCWIEHVDAFRSGDEAHELLSYVTPGEKKHQRLEQLIANPDARTSLSVIEKLENKTGKTSYQPYFEQYGQGILVITEQDPLFSERTLVQLQNDLAWFYNESKSKSTDLLYFKKAYLRFKCSFWVRHGLVQIYPTWGLYHLPDNYLLDDLRED